MKKILSSLMLLLCVTAVMAQTYVPVSTLNELKAAIQADHSAKIRLTDDIDIRNLDAPLCSTFSGIIDGASSVQVGDSTVTIMHKIYGGITTTEMVVDPKDGKEKPKVTNRTRTTCSRLFDKLDHATLMNVQFANIHVEDDTYDEVGVIARSAVNECYFINVKMVYCDVFCDENRGGTMFGYAENSVFQLVSTSFCDVKVNGREGGGLVGHSNSCTFQVCIVSFDTSVFVDGHNGMATGWAGGMVGYSKYDEFLGGISGALVGADESQLGGFAGESVFSNFFRCQNYGTIVHIDYGDFEDLREDRNKKLADIELSPETLGWVVGGTISGAIAVGTVLSLMLSQAASDFIVNEIVKMYFSDNWIELAYWGLDKIVLRFLDNPIAISELIPFALTCTIVLAAIAIAIEIGIAIYNGDDEVGGISGLARGGTFEQCQNYGSLKCRDDNCGGIVGLGLGVTINNCFNSGAFEYDEDDTTGSILGAAEVNPDDNNKRCKVTNCLSTESFHIVGDYHYDDGMDPASGNNYRYVGDEGADTGDPVACEMTVTDFQIRHGYVTWWLNQGIENRSQGIKPWRQGIWESITDHSVLSPTHPEVKIEDLTPRYISTPETLLDFARLVAKEDQFAVGILTEDIDMTGYDWTPIGQDGFTTNFRGIFDGRGHKITNLKCTSDKAVGLFGTVHAGAEIRNVIIGEGCEFTGTGNSGAGAIVGEVPIGWKWGNVVIENCVNYGKVTAKNNVNAGGILGLVRNNTNDNVHIFVNNCGNMGTVTAENGNSALIGGYMRNSGIVTNCWSAGQLRTSTEGVKPYDDSQGHSEFFVGYMDKLDIKNCYVIEKEANVDLATVGSRQAGVEGYSAGALTSGELTYHLNGNTNDVSQPLSWQQALGVDAMPKLGSKGVYHTRTISNTIGTVCLPYALKSDDAIRYYTFSESSTANGEIKLNFVSADSLIAGTPAIFVAKSSADSLTFSGVGEGWRGLPISTENEGWNLLGTYVEKQFSGEAAKTIYYVSGGKIKHGTKATIAPYRAYFSGPSIETLTSTSSGARISIILDGEEDETTALELVYDYENDNENGNRSYTLFGTEAGEGYRGIVIKNGKKKICIM